ncbi:MAG: hypothetical protein NC218_11105 [Acetobacter sp.]|nr:hypothetical protein [Acetobacter sp.]
MFEAKKVMNKLTDVGVFLLLGMLLPAGMMLLFADGAYLDVLPSFYCLYIVTYILHFPLYSRMLQSEERRWWKYILSLLWLYMALGGVSLMWGILV